MTSPVKISESKFLKRKLVQRVSAFIFLYYFYFYIILFYSKYFSTPVILWSFHVFFLQFYNFFCLDL